MMIGDQPLNGQIAFKVDNLRVSFQGVRGDVEVVKGVSFSVAAGRTLAIVGESGSGKSVALLAATGLLGKSARIHGSVHCSGREILGLPTAALREIRGSEIGYIFQDPMSNLHPMKNIENQVAEAITSHRRMAKGALRSRVIELLTEVGIVDAPKRLGYLPHQFSGGMRQRVMIAIAIAMNPKVIVADEPTTALDVTVQASILRLLKRIQERHGTALIFVSHDLAVVSDIADEIAVMRSGVVVESGSAARVQHLPAHPYTRELLHASTIRLANDSAHVDTDIASKAPLLRVEKLVRSFKQPGWFGVSRHKVLDEVTFNLHEGEILGLVGESGSGKSTIGRLVAALDRPDEGVVILDSHSYCTPGIGRQNLTRNERAAVQVIFQDPYSTLNPRRRIRAVLSEPFVNNTSLRSFEIESKVVSLIKRVELPVELLDRYPAHLSGGQRQRIAIARAIALEPQIIVADEPVSALDVSTQRKIVALLRSLRDSHGLSLLFISHDLGVVGELCDRVLVLEAGRIVEQGVTHQVFKYPQHSYTQKLVASIPGKSRNIDRPWENIHV